MITKSEDPYLALLSYRSTPLQNGYTPAELLMGRKLRSTLPLVSEKLTPKLPDTEQLRKDEVIYKRRQTQDYNRRHRASTLPDLSPGERVWLPDSSSPAVVVEKSRHPRSYVVETNQSLLRRNRRHLVPSESMTTQATENKGENATNQDESFTTTTTSETTPNNVVRTRSGRIVKPPTRLNYIKLNV